jgi:hypothetical protein
MLKEKAGKVSAGEVLLELSRVYEVGEKAQ